MAWSKASGHWKWIERTGGDVRFDLEGMRDLLSKPKAETGDNWGKWVYNEKHHTLHFAPNDNNYEIRLRDIRTAEDLVGWLDHLSEKTWMTAADFGDFLEAIGDFIGLGTLAHPSK
jgi:hypothetical protein